VVDLLIDGAVYFGLTLWAMLKCLAVGLLFFSPAVIWCQYLYRRDQKDQQLADALERRIANYRRSR